MLEYKEAVPEAPGAYLAKESWNDFGFWTTFNLFVRLQDGTLVPVGFLRIGNIAMERDGWSRTSDRLPLSFTALEAGYFSLGMEDDYYEVLRRRLPQGTAHEILTSLNDAVYAWEADQETSGLAVFRDSLMRGRSHTDLDRTRRIALGVRARIVSFRWSYTPEQEGLLPAHEFTFETKPGAPPSTNLHAVIGRNGVGKTRLLHAIATHATTGQIVVEAGSGGEDNSFTSCVVISFSPFDRPYIPPSDAEMPFHYIGLRHDQELRLKSDEELRKEFVDSFAVARIGARGLRWRQAVETLNYVASGFLDDDMDVIDAMIREGSPRKLKEAMGDVFDSLSSGHAVVLLMVTRLIEVVGERTLVLIDEPETHLHPPLLAALTNALSKLLTGRNGMAVVATHSPVVLQEVPASCVWRMFRNGTELTASRPTMETYGESVGELTHEAFGLETTSTGFHAAIAEAVDEGGSYEEIAARFTGLGSEARSLLRAMTYTRARGRG
ncbi:AAA family ATPase [Streptomyces rhizosphaericus]|uniref:AAA family ATPase n=1 Tax=Streptomyces rhizosphaericus TaxID=114699 RepID=UPI00117C4BC2|nr:AAA family ATPase [Streptomyces rhizosphaericus]